MEQQYKIFEVEQNLKRLKGEYMVKAIVVAKDWYQARTMARLEAEQDGLIAEENRLTHREIGVANDNLYHVQVLCMTRGSDV